MLSDGTAFRFSGVHENRMKKRSKRSRRWQRKMARRTMGSKRREKAKHRIARLKRRDANIRREFAHQASRRIVDDPRVNLIVMEDLQIKNMIKSAKGTRDNPGKNVRQKSGLNRSILRSAWDDPNLSSPQSTGGHKLLITIPAAYTSQECSTCGHVEKDNRKTQDLFICQDCGYRDNADRNAAKVIAKRGVDYFLSEWTPHEAKTVKITRDKVRQELSEPVAVPPPTHGETLEDVRAERRERMGSQNRETPATASCWRELCAVATSSRRAPRSCQRDGVVQAVQVCLWTTALT